MAFLLYYLFCFIIYIPVNTRRMPTEKIIIYMCWLHREHTATIKSYRKIDILFFLASVEPLLSQRKPLTKNYNVKTVSSTNIQLSATCQSVHWHSGSAFCCHDNNCSDLGNLAYMCNLRPSNGLQCGVLDLKR